MRTQVHPLPSTASLTPSKQALLKKYNDAWPRLIAVGIKVDDLSILSDEKLSNLLKNSVYLKYALHFITKNQILGIDHVPRAISEHQEPEDDNPRDFILYNSNASGFSVTLNQFDHKMYVTYEKSNPKLTAEFTFNTLNQRGKDLFDSQPEMAKVKVPLIHDWITMKGKGSNKDHLYYYRPDTAEFLLYDAEKGFPLDQLETTMQLNFFGYFAEKQFVNTLGKYNITADQLRSTIGLTAVKLDVFCNHPDVTCEVLDAGMTLNDFATADENRLKYIFTHFKSAKIALKFVDIFELFPFEVLHLC